MPKVSVVMPVYNTQEEYLREAIESILNQTFTDFEFIIIDDGSTNGAQEVIKSYSDKRIRFIQNETNLGIFATRNKMCRLAKGEYIACFDSDDISLPTRFEKQVAFLDTHKDISIVSSLYERFPEPFIPYFPERVEALDMLKCCAIAQSVTMYRRADFEAKGLMYDESLPCAGDYDMWSRALIAGLKLANIQEVLLKYRWHPDNISHTKRQLQEQIASDVRERLIAFMTEDKELQQKLRTMFEPQPEQKTKKYYLFNLIPFLKIKQKPKKKKIFLFGLIPFMTVKEDNKGINHVFLFGAPVLNNKIKNIPSKSYKYIHVMENDKFNKPFVDFLNRNFDHHEHLILCKHTCQQFPFPEGDNVIEIQNLNGLHLYKGQKLICHSLFDGEVVNWLYHHKSALKKQAYWVIWGGDLYNAPRDKKNDFVRKNFKGYISSIAGDERVAADKYKSKAVQMNALYPGPKTEDLDFLNTIQKSQKNYIKIQINNSADDTTLEMLDILSKFKDENIKITTVLSYGKLEYKNEIIQKGKDIFGYKFEYIDSYMSPEDYAQYLAQNDILILNQNRQQGVGNAIAAVYLGAKLYIKANITTYSMLKSKNISVYDAFTISTLSFDEFSRSSADEVLKNQKNIYSFASQKALFQAWKKVLGQ